MCGGNWVIEMVEVVHPELFSGCIPNGALKQILYQANITYADVA